VKPLGFVLFALVLAACQASVLRFVGGGSFSLALPVACVVYLGLHAGNVDGVVGAAGTGYVMDLMVATPKGLLTFLAVVLFLGVRAVAVAVDVRGRSAFAVLSGVGVLGMSIAAAALLHYVVPPETAPGATLAWRMIVEAFLTAALSPLVLAGMRAVDKLFHREEPGLLR
jgi:hypothetical protein